MTQFPVPGQGRTSGKPAPNIYTVMLLVAIVALIVSIVVVVGSLTAQPPDGYGMEFSEIFGSKP